MPGNFTRSSAGSHGAPSQLTPASSRGWILVRTTGYVAIFWPILLILAGSNTVIRSAIAPPTAISSQSLVAAPLPSLEQHVQHQASLIRDHLPAYLDFVGTEVLPVMSKNIDQILYDLQGLTDIKPGLFYHGHIDYSIHASGGLDGLMEMNNVVLQYHTLENPLTYIPYWRQELGDLHDRNIDVWLQRINEYNRAISTPGAASAVQYAPLTEYEAVNIAASWDDHRMHNGLASPGLEMLTDMVYLVDGGQQPLYQEAFKNIYRFHSIAFRPEEYIPLDNRTHLEDTFSPFQITFEHNRDCRALLPVFEAASIAGFGYILNANHTYAARQAGLLHGNPSPEMAKLSISLNYAISTLPDDNLIKISTASGDSWIALFAVENYVFAVHGSLDPPPIYY